MTQPAPSVVQTACDEIRQLVVQDLPRLPVLQNQTDGIDAIYNWLATTQVKARPDIRHPRIALFANASAAAQEELAAITAGTHPLCALAQDANADLQVYDVQQAQTHDIGQAMTYGMMAVQPGVDLMALAVLDDTATDLQDFDALVQSPRADIAALCGAVIAARLAKTPAVLAGLGAQAALQILQNLREDAGAHTRIAADIFSASAKISPPQALGLCIPLLKSISKLAHA